MAVDLRRARRLAHRIRQWTRAAQLPAEVWTSPLRRCAAVGQCLAAWGFRHRIDDRLVELDFGRWDGMGWRDIDKAAVDAWQADFVHHGPGGGESLHELRQRVAAFRAAHAHRAALLVVGHAGWIEAASLDPQQAPDPARWGPVLGYGRMRCLPLRQADALACSASPAPSACHTNPCSGGWRIDDDSRHAPLLDP